MGVLRSSLSSWYEDNWRRRRGEEAPVCVGRRRRCCNEGWGQVWHLRFYWSGGGGCGGGGGAVMRGS